MLRSFADKRAFYSHYPLYERGWGGTPHTDAPAGFDTAFARLCRDGERVPRGSGTWTVHVVGAYEDLHGLDDPARAVPGAVTATNYRTGEIVVLKEDADISSVFEAIRDLGSGARPPELTVEQLQRRL